MTTTSRKRTSGDHLNPSKKLKSNSTLQRKHSSTLSIPSHQGTIGNKHKKIQRKNNFNESHDEDEDDHNHNDENMSDDDDDDDNDGALETHTKRNSFKHSNQKSRNKKTSSQDEEITSDSSMDDEDLDMEEMENKKIKRKNLNKYQSEMIPLKLNQEDDNEEDRELADEKRVRLAKAYLEELNLKSEQRKKEDGFNAAELDREIIAKRLKEDKLQAKGVLFRPIAKFYTPSSSFIENFKLQKFPKAHRLSLTCVCVSSTHSWVYTGSKDGSITQWTIHPPQKRHFLPGLSKKNHSLKTSKGHFAAITSLVIYQSLYLISSSEDHLIHVWDLTTLNHVHTFQGHRGKVTGLALNPQESVLYSCSEDKTVKLWDLIEFAYIETLFGHQEPITQISSFGKETCVTSGGRDGTVRYWKITDQSQFIFRTSQLGSLDVVVALDVNWFVAGNDQGGLALWHRTKKKPLHVLPQAHQQWITCLSSLPSTDLLFSGSLDGTLKVWKIITSHSHEKKRTTLPSSFSSGQRDGSHEQDQNQEQEEEDEEDDDDDENTLDTKLKPHAGYGRLQCIASLKVPGCINGISIVPPSIYPPVPKPTSPTSTSATTSTDSPTDLHVYLAIGQEHKLGRWWQFKEVKNRLYKFILPVSKSLSSSKSSLA